ncbi:MAG: O-antigen ligase family protein [Blastocatellia bacterium]
MIDRTFVIPLHSNMPDSRMQPDSARQLVRAWNMPDSRAVPLLLLLHVALGPALIFAPSLGLLHLGIVALMGIWWSALSPRAENVAWVCAYITGAEVMWRMAGAAFFWEFGKYSVIAFLLLTMIRTGRFNGAFLPFLFFILLLPSSVLPTINMGTEDLRKQLSFNLSGPLALAVCTWFFWQASFTAEQVQRIFLAFICPLVSTASLVLFGILSSSKLSFNNSSNFATSGGYGPNQVSAALGLGALAAFLWLFHKNVSRALKATLLATAVFLLAQSALTFSRGGIYAAGASAILASLYLIRDRRLRAQFALGATAIFLVLNFLVLPQLDQFTTGALSKRLADTRMSGRDKIIMDDLEVFNDNMLFGVGPGQAKMHRQSHKKTAAHTEFSRLLAEHGLFGLAALALMLSLAWRHFRRAQTAHAKAIVVALTVWSFLSMASVAMRTVAPAFLFGLAAALFLFEEENSNQAQS